MWPGYDPQFNSVNFFFFHFFFPFALAFLGSVSPLYLFAHILVILHMCSLFYIIQYVIELASDSETNLCSLGSLSLHALHFLLPSFHPHLIPPDENLVGHIKASALGPAALDLRESDLLLVLWSLSQNSLKGRLQPSSNNPLLSTQVEQKGTQCNPVDRGRIENVA